MPAERRKAQGRAADDQSRIGSDHGLSDRRDDQVNLNGVERILIKAGITIC
jgi:hypothetical protein